MENAVKALLMVAGLIIGVLVIGLLVYLFRMGGNVGSNFEQSMSEGVIVYVFLKMRKKELLKNYLKMELRKM